MKHDYYGVMECAREAERLYANYEEPTPIVCNRCHEVDNYYYNGVCRTCLSEVYDEHEDELLPFFEEYDPEEWDDLCPAPLNEMWENRADPQFREYLKEFAIEDEWCLSDYFKDKGWI